MAHCGEEVGLRLAGFLGFPFGSRELCDHLFRQSSGLLLALFCHFLELFGGVQLLLQFSNLLL